MADDTGNAIVKWGAGVIASLAVLGIAGLILLYVDVQILKDRLERGLGVVDEVARQQRQDSLHWRYLNELEKEINRLRFQHGLEPWEHADLSPPGDD